MNVRLNSIEEDDKPMLDVQEGDPASLRAKAFSCAGPATHQPDGQITSDFQKLCQARDGKIFRWPRRPNQRH
jgi:hypothetical protein